MHKRVPDRWLAAILWLIVLPLQADLMPYYRMDSFIFLSDAVIYCDELDVQEISTQHVNWSEHRTIVRCRVLRTIKGDIAKGMVIVIDYGPWFRRQFGSDTPYDVVDRNGRLRYRHEPWPIARGRALVFLKKDEDGRVRPLTAKLVQHRGVFRFVQVVNPGPLRLVRQGPENITLTPGEPYGEAELLRDAEVARDKAKLLTAPVRADRGLTAASSPARPPDR